jgi:hypothetical protein
MRYLFTLGACLAVSVTLAVAYVAFPRTERDVALQLPARPSLAMLKTALGNVQTIDTAVTMVDGQPFRCFKADSTFSPTEPGASWGMQWCWRTSRSDFASSRQDVLEG